MAKEYTLSTLLSELEDKYDATKRPKRYFDVKKRGKLTKKEVSYVKKRFKELVDREKCVKKDPDNPKCYEKVSTDKKPRRKKRRSSYLKDYEEIYGPRKDKSWKETYSSELSKLKKRYKRAPLGLLRIAVETGLPYTAIKEVYDIGVGAYASSGSRPGMSGEQWGYGRVYAFIMSYFFNEDGRYDDQRFFQNKSDFHVLEKIMRENPATEGSCEEDWTNLRDYYTQSFEENKHDFAELISDLDDKVSNRKTVNPRDVEHLGYSRDDFNKNILPTHLTTKIMEDIYFRYESNEELQELANRIKSYNVYGNMRYSDVINKMKHFIPPVFGMPAVQFLTKPFYFVHFTGQYKLELIESRGFKGRSEISTLFSTRQSFSEYSYKSGYVYGYLLKSTSHGDALEEVAELATKYNVSVPSGDYDPHWVVTSASFVIAVATKGLEIYHSMDKENQLIVPVSCIEDWSIQTYPRALEGELDDMQEGNVEDHYPFDPQEYPEFYGDYEEDDEYDDVYEDEDYDDEDDDDRENPSLFLEDYDYILSYVEMDPFEVKEEMLENYPMSAGDPEKFLEEHPKEFYNHLSLRNFIFIGPKGRCLRIYAEDLVPLQGNIFYEKKLKAVAESPNVFDFKIPFFVGFVDLFSLDCDEILEFTEQKLEYGDEDLRYEDFLHLTSEDVDNIFFQLRDGNHRSWGALLSGEEYIYAQVYENTYQAYANWVKSGKPKDVPGYDKFVYLDENLI